jgi:catechol 2,3-dioxygenase-like lactoylglutathione lyase family enzyme
MATDAMLAVARLASNRAPVDHPRALAPASSLARPGDDPVIKAIKFASIPVSDQDRALDFYTKKLGLRVITDTPLDGRQRWIELGIPRAETRLVLFTAPGQAQMIGGLMNVAFSADDVEATAKDMKARGVEFVQEPRRADWGTSAVFKDPDGNQFVLSTT